MYRRDYWGRIDPWENEWDAIPIKTYSDAEPVLSKDEIINGLKLEVEALTKAIEAMKKDYEERLETCIRRKDKEVDPSIPSI